MAIIRNNPLTQGLSGMLGKTIVFRNWNGQTILANRPKAPTKQSVQQKNNRNKFREATEFAKAVTKDPVKKQYYKEKALLMKLPNAYTAAITDYMRKPVIETEKKQDGSAVVTVTKKDFTLAKVDVILKTKGAANTFLRTITPDAFDDCTTNFTAAELAMNIVLRITDATGSLLFISVGEL